MQNFLKPVSSNLPDFRQIGTHLNWIALLLFNLLIIISLRYELVAPAMRVWAPHLVLNLFLIALLYYHGLQIKAVDNPTFLPLLYKLGITSGLGIAGVFLLETLVFFLGDTALLANAMAASVLYTLQMLAGGVVLTALLVGFKRLILFEKTRLLIVAWRLFEWGLITTSVLSLFNIQFNTLFYNVVFVALAGLGLLLSVNLKWVGYLDFRQKLQALGVLVLQLLCLLFFAWFLYYYASEYHLLFSAVDNILLLVLLSFALFCTALSVLVIFFNLPTSSVFEKKLESLNGIKQLQQSLRKKQNEEELYQLLLENAQKATDAQLAWIQLKQESGSLKYLYSEAQEHYAIDMLIDALQEEPLKTGLQKNRIGGRRRAYYLTAINHSPYKSALVLPLRLQDHLVGYLVLLRNVSNGFNKDALGIARLYADQTCLSVENLQLLQEAIRIERYQEELAIARRVKESLLPEKICCNTDCQMAVCSESADDVGGDYYDAYRLDEQRVALVVADVSGHGTSAAFTMSQFKGVFHSLVPLGLGCTEFLQQANSALGRGLARSTFVTLVYGILNSSDKTFTFVRAGHCPVLHFREQENKVNSYFGKGMGLGLLRDQNYREQLEEQVIHYRPGDALLLYTDGIIECRNPQGEEWGLERLSESFKKWASKKEHDSQEICRLILQDLQYFALQKEISDDFTTMVLKFS